MTNINEPHNYSIWEMALKIAPGFFGSVIAAYYLSKPVTKFEAIGAIASGTLTSVFLAPYIVHLIAPDVPSAYSGIGFATGAVTIVFIPVFVRKAQELINAINWKLIGEWFPWKKQQ